MNDVKIFENPEFGRVRTTVIDGEPWFVAADVCRALDLGNPIYLKLQFLLSGD